MIGSFLWEENEPHGTTAETSAANSTQRVSQSRADIPSALGTLLLAEQEFSPQNLPPSRCAWLETADDDDNALSLALFMELALALAAAPTSTEMDCCPTCSSHPEACICTTVHLVLCQRATPEKTVPFAYSRQHKENEESLFANRTRKNFASNDDFPLPCRPLTQNHRQGPASARHLRRIRVHRVDSSRKLLQWLLTFHGQQRAALDGMLIHSIDSLLMGGDNGESERTLLRLASVLVDTVDWFSRKQTTASILRRPTLILGLCSPQQAAVCNFRNRHCPPPSMNYNNNHVFLFPPLQTTPMNVPRFRQNFSALWSQWIPHRIVAVPGTRVASSPQESSIHIPHRQQNPSTIDVDDNACGISCSWVFSPESNTTILRAWRLFWLTSNNNWFLPSFEAEASSAPPGRHKKSFTVDVVSTCTGSEENQQGRETDTRLYWKV